MVGNLIKAEWFRIIHGKSFYIMILIGFIYIFSQVTSITDMIINSLAIEVEEFEFDWIEMGVDEKFILELEALEGMERLPIYGYLAFRHSNVDAIMMFFTPFLIVSLFASEYNKKTIYALISLVENRINIFWGKYIVLFTMIFILHSFFALTSTISATLLNGWGNDMILIPVANILMLVFKMTFYQMALGGLTFVLSFIIRHDSVVILSHFVASIIESIVASIVISFRSSNVVFNFLHNLLPTVYSHTFLGRIGHRYVGMNISAWISILLVILMSVLISLMMFKRQDLV